MNLCARLWLVICLSTVFTACDKKSISSEDEVCREKIELFDKSIQRDKYKFRKKAEEVCGQISMVSNSVERLYLFRRLTEVLLKTSLKECTSSEKESLELDYWKVHEYLSYCLVKENAAVEEAWGLIYDGFSKYREMCFSFGKENDYSDGMGRDARKRRGLAKGMRLAWENSTSYFEQRGIDNVFGTRSPEAAKRFLERWHKEFGCHNKDCPEWKKLSTNVSAPCPKDK